MKYEKTLKVPQKELETYQRLLNIDELDFEAENIKEDSTIKTYSCKFEDGFMAEVKICCGQTNCYVDAILLSPTAEVVVLEPDWELLGTYFFKYNGNEYLFTLETEIK